MQTMKVKTHVGTTVDCKKVAGVWMPTSEDHFPLMMQPKAKRYIEIDGKCAYQGHKWQAALGLLPKDRRRHYVDCGAHVGLWAMFLCKEFAKTTAFEPVPDHLAIFPHNVPPDHSVELIGCALGAHEGIVTLETAADETGSCHIAVGEGGDARRGKGPVLSWKNIQMRTLDSFELQDVDFIKIDVEGSEHEVVKGMEDTCLRCSPMVLVEQKGNDEIGGYGVARGEAHRILHSWGYRDLKVISGDHIMMKP